MIDYSALEEAKPKRLESPNTDLIKTIPLLGSLIVAAIYYAFLLFFLPIVFLVTGLNAVIGNALFIVWILIAVYGVHLISKYVYKGSYHMVRLSNFAVENDFKYRMGKKISEDRKVSDVKTHFKGFLAGSDSTRKISAEISGSYEGFDFLFYNLRRFTSKGSYTIFEVPLKQNYPHIFLDARKNNWIMSNVTHPFTDKNKVSLESEFEKYFEVYSMVDPTLTLQVIEPSIMQAMIDNVELFDIEIVEDKIYLIFSFEYADSKMMKQLFTAADSLVKNLDAAPL